MTGGARGPSEEPSPLLLPAGTMRATHLLPALLLHQLLLLPTAIPAAGQCFYRCASDPRPPRSRSTAPLPRSAAQGGRALGRRSEPAGRSPQVRACSPQVRSRRWGWQPRPAGLGAAVPPCRSGRAALQARSPAGRGPVPAAEPPPLPPPAPGSLGPADRQRGEGNLIIAQRCSRPLSGGERVSLISSGRINVK